MAEFVFKNIVNKRGLTKEFLIESAATSREDIGEGCNKFLEYILRRKNK